jgi:hypothetical protein
MPGLVSRHRGAPNAGGAQLRSVLRNASRNAGHNRTGVSVSRSASAPSMNTVECELFGVKSSESSASKFTDVPNGRAVAEQSQSWLELD